MFGVNLKTNCDYNTSIKKLQKSIKFKSLEMGHVLGIAYLNSVCQNNAVAVVKHNNQLEITNTVTHELGHM